MGGIAIEGELRDDLLDDGQKSHKGRKFTVNTRPTVPTGWAVDRSESVSYSQNQSAITPPYTLHPFVPCAQSYQACLLPTGGAWHPSNEHNRPIETCCPPPSPLLLNERTPPSHDCVDTHAHTNGIQHLLVLSGNSDVSKGLPLFSRSTLPLYPLGPVDLETFPGFKGEHCFFKLDRTLRMTDQSSSRSQGSGKLP